MSAYGKGAGVETEKIKIIEFYFREMNLCCGLLKLETKVELLKYKEKIMAQGWQSIIFDNCDQ